MKDTLIRFKNTLDFAKRVKKYKIALPVEYTNASLYGGCMLVHVELHDEGSEQPVLYSTRPSGYSTPADSYKNQIYGSSCRGFIIDSVLQKAHTEHDYSYDLRKYLARPGIAIILFTCQYSPPSDWLKHVHSIEKARRWTRTRIVEIGQTDRPGGGTMHHYLVGCSKQWTQYWPLFSYYLGMLKYWWAYGENIDRSLDKPHGRPIEAYKDDRLCITGLAGVAIAKKKKIINKMARMAAACRRADRTEMKRQMLERGTAYMHGIGISEFVREVYYNLYGEPKDKRGKVVITERIGPIMRGASIVAKAMQEDRR